MRTGLPTGSRMVRLDGLRGVAVLCVLLFHAGYFLIPSLVPNLLPGGFIGVDLFFVLSGFLMTNILLERRQSFGRFYVRRAARIFPALYVFLAAQLVYSWITGSGLLVNLRAYLLIMLGSGNWGNMMGITLPFGLGQTWSLGVEEQLYLLWPLTLLLFGRRDRTRIGRLCLAGIVVSMIVKLAMLKSGIPTVHIYGQTEARLDDFLVGAFVATLRTPQPARAIGPLALGAGLFLAGCLAVAHPYTSAWMYEGGFTAIAVCGGVILYAALHQVKGTGILASRPLRAAGRYSYALYLWHPLVFLAVSNALPHDLPLRVAVAAGSLWVAAMISTRVVEEPLRRLAARATWSRFRRAVAVAPAV